jgi:hypothetical protein
MWNGDLVCRDHAQPLREAVVVKEALGIDADEMCTAVIARQRARNDARSRVRTRTSLLGSLNVGRT